MQLDPCDETVDITLTVRIRAFGNEKTKQITWDRDWRTSEQQAKRKKPWGPAAAGVSVSSDPPEVWCDLRVTKAGLVLPPHVLAHEIMHSLRLKDKQLINPDLLSKEGTY